MSLTTCVCGKEYERHEILCAPPAPSQERPPIDVERLAEAWGNVMDGRRLHGVRISSDTTTPDDWSAIAAEYLRLSGSVGE